MCRTRIGFLCKGIQRQSELASQSGQSEESGTTDSPCLDAPDRIDANPTGSGKFTAAHLLATSACSDQMPNRTPERTLFIAGLDATHRVNNTCIKNGT